MPPETNFETGGLGLNGVVFSAPEEELEVPEPVVEAEQTETPVGEEEEGVETETDEAVFALRHFAFVKAGGPYKYGDETRTHADCPDKDLKLHTQITDDMAKKKIGDKMGIPYDKFPEVRTCLFLKSRERDSKGWHSVDVNLATKKEADSSCKKVTHTLDHAHKDMLPDLGKHPTKDLVKGCGE